MPNALFPVKLIPRKGHTRSCPYKDKDTPDAAFLRRAKAALTEARTSAPAAGAAIAAANQQTTLANGWFPTPAASGEPHH